MLEATNGISAPPSKASQSVSKRQSSCTATICPKCNYCSGEHLIYRCKQFLALPVQRRITEIRSRKICANCLRSTSHVANKCASGSCRVCQAKHNTLLHSSSSASETSEHNANPDDTKPSGSATVLAAHALGSINSSFSILSTAVVHAFDINGSPHSCRVLLDCGSEINLISKRFLDTLGIISRPSNITISGVNGTISTANQKVNLKLQSRINSYTATIECIVADKVTDRMSALPLKRNKFLIPHTRSSHITKNAAGLDFSRTIGRPRIAFKDTRTSEENFCEQHFISNVTQTSQGRYIVKLPVKEHLISNLGDSRAAALKRLFFLERRFRRDPQLKIQYSQFVDEYLSLDHMRLINALPEGRSVNFYLPHHCVYKVTDQSSKLRVVFDASCKTISGISLNDALMVGPVIQQDLASILTRFRIFQYVISADIIKMYRQILVDPSQASLQRILWRSDPNSDIQTYELSTLTYGTSSASFLATRCLKHLAEQHASIYPVGSTCVQCDFYVDDMLSGADTIEEVSRIRDETIQLLRRGSFKLSKWASNCRKLLEAVDNRNGEVVSIDDQSNSSILGIQWNQISDTFHFSCKLNTTPGVVSKRVILSEVSRLFDPLGLLGPVIVTAKLILQELWQSEVHWDESVPQDIHSRGSKLRSQLFDINQLQIPRCVKPNSNSTVIQVHGFCDASQRAYGPCVYIRVELGLGKYQFELLCSRSRVAPLKAVSLPKLELCAAVLLARLIGGRVVKLRTHSNISLVGFHDHVKLDNVFV
ncbi:uncharacterized protein LOC120357330 [Solenopsis invicta]|uniref:uncharacterized protein LOC120357330 n=1 Tax=Solenopsis invicta TaxID=13686 RepID=UPI00193D3828|nr:uncharacterized protein LOC120357330 [Solenopsis invicta]